MKGRHLPLLDGLLVHVVVLQDLLWPTLGHVQPMEDVVLIVVVILSTGSGSVMFIQPLQIIQVLGPLLYQGGEVLLADGYILHFFHYVVHGCLVLVQTNNR